MSYSARGIYGGNAAEPGDYELETPYEPDQGYEMEGKYVPSYDEHVDGCDCPRCDVMLFEVSDTQFLLLEHRQMRHAVLVDDCPACESYSVEELVDNDRWGDVPF